MNGQHEPADSLCHRLPAAGAMMLATMSENAPALFREVQSIAGDPLLLVLSLQHRALLL